MTKKEFISKVRHETYTGHGIKINAFYFDWKQGDIEGKYFGGFKYMVSADNRQISKKKLLDQFYLFVVKNGLKPDFSTCRVAETDNQRFKIPLSI